MAAQVDVKNYFKIVIKGVSNKWEELAEELGFDDNEIGVIRDLKRDDDRRCREMLTRWRNRKGRDATLQVLKKALIDIDQAMVAQSLNGESGTGPERRNGTGAPVGIGTDVPLGSGAGVPPGSGADTVGPPGSDFDLPTTAHAKTAVLLVATEYGTSKGGISTINRQVARVFKAAGAEVYITVLEASKQDKKDAKRDKVKLVKPDKAGSDAKPSLEWLSVYHDTHFPKLPENISCIVGHADVTSKAARKIKEKRFPHAKLAMFGHVAPEETEHYKSDEKALGVGRKEASIQDDIGKADVVFSVGPRIHRHYDRFIRRNRVDHYIFLPEPSKVFRDTDVSFGEEDGVRKPERVVLSIGRVRNVEMLKGHDLAAGSIDKVAERLDNQYTLRLRVRGIDENDFKDSKRILDEKLRSGRVKPTLLPYGTQEEICRDMEDCHLVLMPSRAEPFGLVGLEAIAAGVPVLISEHSGLAELIEELSDRMEQPTFRHCIVKMKGATATDGDVEKWAERIEDVLKKSKSEFREACAFREKLLDSKYWEESHQKLLQACGITGGLKDQPELEDDSSSSSSDEEDP